MRLIATIALGLLAAVLPAHVAWAHSGGVGGSGCGCHGAGTVGLDITTNPAMIDPGQTVTVTVTVSSPTAAEAGLFLQANAGDYSTLAGQGLAEVMAGLTHNQPKALGGDQAQFSFQWTAPAAPGAVRFEVWGVAANGNNSSSGDASDDAAFDFVYGCEPQTYWRDFDGDGYGRTNLPRIHCAGAPPTGYATLPDDCDDNRADTHPGATEYCNEIDDDCDTEIDEDAIPVDLYPDGDEDGYYGQAEYESGDMLVGCVGLPGYAALPGDCRPEDPAINPGVEEECNGFDDDCDADVDERVRPQCGEGWCRRESINCEALACTPGEPRAEECNFFDDDCDTIVDEDAPCPEGQSCQAGECRTADDPGGLDGSGSAGGGDAGSSDGAGSGTGSASAGQADDAGGSGCACRQARSGAPGAMGAAWLLLGLASVRGRRRRPREVSPRSRSTR
jgi:Putative metal-binding motif